jgi:dihydroorotate dehydrogenase electron transfer subunit
MDDIEGKIVRNDNIVSNYYLLKMKLSKPMGVVKPGQFVMLKIPDSEVFLRRPFSIYACSRDLLTIMYRVVGRGTAYLSKIKKKENTFVLGPLGNGFRLKEKGNHVIVAGGIGIAGVHSLIEKLRGKASVFYGCSGRDEVALVEDIAYLNPYVSTIDGSYGFKGHVIALLAKHLKSIRRNNVEIFACGPENMLKSLKKLINKDTTPCQVLVEERMACGLGLCYGCVKKTTDEEEPYKRVCREGPVFNLWEICL